jgi:hypothetical protein
VFRISLSILYQGGGSISTLKPKEDLLWRSSLFGLYAHPAVSLTISFQIKHLKFSAPAAVQYPPHTRCESVSDASPIHVGRVY